MSTTVTFGPASGGGSGGGGSYYVGPAETRTALLTMPVDPYRIATAQTLAGWLGQLKLNGRIVWESAPLKNEKRAAKAARKRREKALTALVA